MVAAPFPRSTTVAANTPSAYGRVPSLPPSRPRSAGWRGRRWWRNALELLPPSAVASTSIPCAIQYPGCSSSSAALGTSLRQLLLLSPPYPHAPLKDRNGEPEGGSEWEPIKILFKNSAYKPNFTRAPPRASLVTFT
jgi:hypothetical protein